MYWDKLFWLLYIILSISVFAILQNYVTLAIVIFFGFLGLIKLAIESGSRETIKVNRVLLRKLKEYE